MAHVVVTGFEPFGRHSTNPSAQVAQALSDRDGWHTQVLPVDFDRCGAMIADLIVAHTPDVVLCLGLAGEAAVLEFERVAINLIDTQVPDNAGNQPIDVPIIDGGPDAYFTTLPVKAMRTAATDAGVPAALSLSAGTYGCNAVMYAALHTVATHGLATRAGFAHLPEATELSVADAARGVIAAVECALVTGADERTAAGALH